MPIPLRRVAGSDVVDRIVLVVSADAVPDGEAIVRDLGIPKIAAVCAGGAPPPGFCLSRGWSQWANDDGSRFTTELGHASRPKFWVAPSMKSGGFGRCHCRGAGQGYDQGGGRRSGDFGYARPRDLCGRRKLRRHLIIKHCWTPTAPRMSNTLMTRPWSRLPATGVTVFLG